MADDENDEASNEEADSDSDKTSDEETLVDAVDEITEDSPATDSEVEAMLRALAQRLDDRFETLEDRMRALEGEPASSAEVEVNVNGDADASQPSDTPGNDQGQQASEDVAPSSTHWYFRKVGNGYRD